MVARIDRRSLEFPSKSPGSLMIVRAEIWYVAC